MISMENNMLHSDTLNVLYAVSSLLKVFFSPLQNLVIVVATEAMKAE